MNSSTFNQTLMDFSNAAASLGASLLVQSTLLIGAALISSWLCRKRGAAVQSLILRATLIAVLMCPLVSHLFLSLGMTRTSFTLPKAITPGFVGPAPVERLATSSADAPSQAVEQMAIAPSSISPQSDGAAQTVALTAPTATVATEAGNDSLSGNIGAQANSSPATQNPSPILIPAAEPSHASHGLGLLYVAFALVWACGALLLLSRLAICHLRMGRGRWQARMADVSTFERCQAVARELGLEPPEVLVHEKVHSPMLVGLFRPAIVLPAIDEPEALVASREVLVHELAHLKRGDCLWHLLSRLATALMFFQPLLWLLARRIEETAEEVCDNYVIERVPDRRAYARTLVELAELIESPRSETVVGVGVIAFKSALGQRIVRILDSSRKLGLRMGALPSSGIVLFTALATGLAGLLIGVNAEADRSSKPDGSAGLTLKILLSSPPGASFSTLSPDETKVAFVDWVESHIVIKDLQNGTTRKVNAAEANVFFAEIVWSPDSKQIAYASWAGPTNSQLRVTSLVRGEYKVLKDGSSEITYLPADWSADGTYLLCDMTKQDKTRGLAAIDTQTGEARQLISFDWTGAEHPRFSPDAKCVVFEREMEENRDVFLLPIGGTQLTRLTDSPAQDGHPLFSPDSRMVLFSSNRRGTWDLWGVELKEGKPVDPPRMIKPDFGDHAKWLTRQGKISFRGGFQGTDVYSVDVNANKGGVLSPPKLMTKSFFGQHLSPVWSPDGKKLACIRGPNLLCIQTLADGREELIRTGMNGMNKVYWSPDGKWIALSPSGPKGQYGVHAYNLETRELKPVYVNLEGSHHSKGWSQDSKEFFMTHFMTHIGNFKAFHLATGKARDVFSGIADAVLHFDFSADGKRIAFVTRKSDNKEEILVVADRQFQNKRVLKSFGISEQHAGWPRWSPDGTMIAYYQWPVEDSLGSGSELWVTAADGAWESKVECKPFNHYGNLKPPEWSPDSSKLGMTLDHPGRGEIGVLENFLPQASVAAR